MRRLDVCASIQDSSCEAQEILFSILQHTFKTVSSHFQMSLALRGGKLSQPALAIHHAHSNGRHQRSLSSCHGNVAKGYALAVDFVFGFLPFNTSSNVR